MERSLRQAVLALILMALVTLAATAAVVWPGYETPPRQLTIPSFGECAPPLNGTDAQTCEKVAIAWPTLPACTGAVSSYSIFPVNFSLQPYLNCNSTPGRGLSVSVTEPTGAHFEFSLDEAQSSVPWLNWTAPDGLAAVEWQAQPTGPYTVTLQAGFAGYPITFTETGLPAGTNWGVIFSETIGHSTSDRIQFGALNGPSSYWIVGIAGYNVVPSSGTVNVMGSGISESIVFTPLPA